MDIMRKPFQGVTNIIRFNWHFYVTAFAFILLLAFAANFVGASSQPYIFLICGCISVSVILSLLASLYVYDLSGLYHLRWIEERNTDNLILNVNAGFDETSALLKAKFSTAELVAVDFYDPLKHTEASIKRARKAYPAYPGTKQINTQHLLLPDNSADKIFVILAAHEIRDEAERALFFKELSRVVKPSGQIYITEHLRDLSNFLAYNIGFFHFYSKSSWLNTFRKADLQLSREMKLTPFISTFILSKDGATL